MAETLSVLLSNLRQSGVYLFLCLFIASSINPFSVSALSPEQKNLYLKGINYFDFACSMIASQEDRATVSGNVQDLAKQMLENNNISYWTNNGVNTRDVVVALSNGEKAYTTAANAESKTADINPNILKFILEVAATDRIMVNALTDKTHTSKDSNHYKGLAVDLDSNAGNSAPLSVLNPIAEKYGGVKNNETDHHHYDFLERPKESEMTSAPLSTGSALYMVGDSITAGSEQALKQVFESKGLSPYINGSDSRSITQPGESPRTSGMQAIEDDKARIQNASAVVIALGTNQRDGNIDGFKSAIKDMVNKIKNINGGVKIYWVNVFSKGGSSGYDRVDTDSINKAIADAAAGLGIQVIDTTNAGIVTADSVHPTTAGSKTFAKLIADAIVGGATARSSSALSCECGEGTEGSIDLVGNDNKEKIWNFFLGKGLETYQVAGIMGNIEVESGYDPRALQPSTTGDWPVPNQGYGLVQWTDSSRQNSLIQRYNQAKEKNSSLKIYDLTFQLEHIWWELQNTESAAFSSLKASSNWDEATRVFSHKYERPAEPDNPARWTAARKALTEFGSGGSGATSSSGSVTCETDASGEITGEYSLPLDKKYITETVINSIHHSSRQAVDIPAPAGAKVYSMTSGEVISAGDGYNGGMGTHVIVKSDGSQFEYYHGVTGSLKVKTGDQVNAGQPLMLVDDTGSSQGNHLHITLYVDGDKKCPQQLLKGIVNGSPPDIKNITGVGCS